MRQSLLITAEVADNGDKVTLHYNAPAKGVVPSVPISDPGDDAEFEEDFIDLVRGEVVEVGVRRLEGRQVEVCFLYDWQMSEGFEL